MKVVERRPDDLTEVEMDAILRTCTPTKVKPLTEHEVDVNQTILRRRLEAAGRGRAAGR